MTGPWSNTVEAADSDELQSARRIAVALEQRLAEVRAEIVKAGNHGTKYGDLRSRLSARLLALIDTPLGEPFAGYFTGRSSESA